MIKVLIAFVFLFSLFFLGFKAIRQLNGLDTWRLTKHVAYSTMCAVLTIMVLAAIVIIF